MMAVVKNLYCDACGAKLIREEKGGNTISVKSPRYNHHGHILNICRDCAKAEFKRLLKRYKKPDFNAQYRMALLRFCEIYDIPFYKDLIPTMYGDEFLFTYLKMVYQHTSQSKSGLKFDHGDVIFAKDILTPEQLKLYVGKLEEETKEDDTIPPKKLRYNKNLGELIERWGDNKEYTTADYEYLDNKYNEIIGANSDNIDIKVKSAAEASARYMLVERQKLMEGDVAAAKQARDALDKAMASAMLRVTDEKDVKEAKLQDIVTKFEEEKMIEPWEFYPEYDHSLDLAEQITLILLNDARRNEGLSPLNKLPTRLVDYHNQCTVEPTQWEKEIKNQLQIYELDDEYREETSEKDEEEDKE